MSLRRRRPAPRLQTQAQLHHDLGVDIELYDALQRIRFEHPEIRTVVITSAKNRVFCSGANIYNARPPALPRVESELLQIYEQETRNGIEDSSANSGLKKFLAALNGSTMPSRGSYELALACDDIVLILTAIAPPPWKRSPSFLSSAFSPAPAVSHA